MTRAHLLLAALGLLSLTLLSAAPLAAACCHVYELEEQVGPCVLRWEGDVFGGLQTDRVLVACAGHGVAVENPVPGPREGGWPWDALP